MILDNSGIDYARILLFLFDFRVYFKTEPNSRAFPSLRQHLIYDILQSGHVKVVKKNVTSTITIFKVLLQ